MGSSLSLSSLAGPLWPGAVVLDSVVSMGQGELFENVNCVQSYDLCKIELLEIVLFLLSTVRKQTTDV